jgi:hypothetical protein
MPDFSSRFGGRFLTAENIDQPFVGTIERIEDMEMQEDGGRIKKRPVVFFEGYERAAVLNATRYHFLTELMGSRGTDDWIGKQVGVRKGKTSYAGKRLDCVEFCKPAAIEECPF